MLSVQQYWSQRPWACISCALFAYIASTVVSFKFGVHPAASVTAVVPLCVMVWFCQRSLSVLPLWMIKVKSDAFASYTIIYYHIMRSVSEQLQYQAVKMDGHVRGGPVCISPSCAYVVAITDGVTA